MSKIKDYISQLLSQGGDIIQMVVAGVVIIVAGLLLIKAIKEFHGGNAKGGLTKLGFAAIVVIIGVMGVGGLKKAVDRFGPDASIIPRDNISLISHVNMSGQK